MKVFIFQVVAFISVCCVAFYVAFMLHYFVCCTQNSSHTYRNQRMRRYGLHKNVIFVFPLLLLFFLFMVEFGFFFFFLFSDAHLLLRLLLFSGLLFIFQSQPRELKICFQVRCCFLVSSSFFVENKRTLLIMDIFVWPQSIGSSKTPRNVDRWSEQQ